MGIKHPSNSVFPSTPTFPAIEWVFGCDTVFGRMSPTFRRTRHRDGRFPQVPHRILSSAARRYSFDWLEHASRSRGPCVSKQGGISHFGMHINCDVEPAEMEFLRAFSADFDVEWFLSFGFNEEQYVDQCVTRSAAIQPLMRSNQSMPSAQRCAARSGRSCKNLSIHC